MPDHIEQAALLIAHPKMTRPAKLHPDCPVCQNAMATVRQLADAGLLADPEQHDERLDRALWLWAEEKWRREQLLAQRQQWWDTVGREKAALTEQRNIAVWLHAEACDDRDHARAQRDEAIQTAGQLRDQVAAGHRVQLAVAGQWLGHAAEKLGDAPAAAYLQALAEWLTGNAEGDEPEAPGG